MRELVIAVRLLGVRFVFRGLVQILRSAELRHEFKASVARGDVVQRPVRTIAALSLISIALSWVIDPFDGRYDDLVWAVRGGSWLVSIALLTAVVVAVQNWAAPRSVRRPAVRLPGSWVQRALRCIVSQKTLEREVKPTIADMQYEYARALGERRWRRAFILLRGYFSIACTLGLGGIVRLAKAIWKSAGP